MKIISMLSSCLFLITLMGCEPQTQTPANSTADVAVAAAKPEAVDPATASSDQPMAHNDCVLRLGFEAWEPYQFTDLDQKAAGLDIELVQAIAEQMHCTLEPQQSTWIDLMGLLKEGKVDLLLGASKTPAREEFAYFSEPYRNEQFVLFIRSANAASLPQENLADFIAAGKKIGIVSEYYYGPEFAQLYRDEKFRNQFVEASLSELSLARLIDEEIDAMLDDSFVGQSMLRRKGLEHQIGVHSITLGSSDVFVMLSKASVTAEQLAAFNQGLAAIRANGTYAAIISKYQQ